jgi:hypothetical protein
MSIKSQKDFEEWARARHFDLQKSIGGETYFHANTDAAWQVWEHKDSMIETQQKTLWEMQNRLDRQATEIDRLRGVLKQAVVQISNSEMVGELDDCGEFHSLYGYEIKKQILIDLEQALNGGGEDE